MKKLLLSFLVLSSACWGNDQLDLLISEQEISQKVKEVAAKIDEDFRGEEVTILMVMKGAICMTADLIRSLTIPNTVEYMKASSYGLKGIARGELKIIGLDNLDLSGKNVLVVDDIFDTGNTMAGIVERLKEKNPKSIKSLVLLNKKVDRKISYRPDYSLFDIENRFVVGYGLDYKEYYRGLPGIFVLTPDSVQSQNISN